MVNADNQELPTTKNVPMLDRDHMHTAIFFVGGEEGSCFRGPAWAAVVSL